MSGQPPTAETIVEALPSEVTLEQLARALLALGVPLEVAAYVTEARLDPTRCEIEVATNLRGARVRVTLMVDSRRGVTWNGDGP